MSGQDFSDEQKRYLEGFVSGVQASRAAAGLKPLSGVGGGSAEPAGPDADHLKAMARFEAEGKRLSPEEKAKRDEHPFDAYARLKTESAKGQYPKGVDNFRWRFHGLYYVAPAQNSYMCRLRIPNGILTHWQLAGAADIAERYCQGYAHVTTRANLQVREIAAEHAIAVLEDLAEIGLVAKGSGADNIRNVTGSPTAGIDAQELLDTRPYRASLAPSHPQRPIALWLAAQVQCRLRRWRHYSRSGGHQRHRFHGGAGWRWRGRRARRVVQARAGRHYRAPGLRAAHRRTGEAGGCGCGR